MKLIFYSIGLIFFLSACSTVAITQRKQLSLVSNDELIAASFSQYQEVIKGSKLSDDAKKQAMIQRVGEKIQKAVTAYYSKIGQSEILKDYQWEFRLIDDATVVNAWCMPGGKVAFYTGILPICENENGIAVVMGHEIAHAIANHGRERVSQQIVTQTGLQVIDGVLSQSAISPQKGNLIMQAVGASTTLGLLAFSRKHESEADRLGLIFMTMAGYDPYQAPLFWERMKSQQSKTPVPVFLSTHPSHEKRIADLRNWIPEAKTYQP